jgi:hypothetical protein
MLEECDAVAYIVAVFDNGGPMAKVPHDDDGEVLPCFAPTHITRSPWNRTNARGLEEPGWVSRELLPFDQSD